MKVNLTIDLLSESFEVNLFVISNATLKADIILGKEFLHEQKLTLVYKLADKPFLPEINLFTILPLHVLEDLKTDKNDNRQL